MTVVLVVEVGIVGRVDFGQVGGRSRIGVGLQVWVWIKDGWRLSFGGSTASSE